MMEDLTTTYQMLEENGITASKVCKIVSGSDKKYVSLTFDMLKSFLNEEMNLNFQDDEIASVLKRIDCGDHGKVSIQQLDQYFQVFKTMIDPDTEMDNLAQKATLQKTTARVSPSSRGR